MQFYKKTPEKSSVYIFHVFGISWKKYDYKSIWLSYPKGEIVFFIESLTPEHTFALGIANGIANGFSTEFNVIMNKLTISQTIVYR